MTNSVWKPFSEIPSVGHFLVWAPDDAQGRKPYLGSNVTICNCNPNGLKFLCGNMEWDMDTPTLYCEITSLTDQLPIQD